MKEELIEELASYLKGTKDFILEQAPEIFNQIIRFELIACSCFIVIFSGVSVFSFYIFQKWLDSSKYDFFGVIGLMAGIGSAIFVLSCFYDLLLVLFAPKYYLIKLILHIGK